MSIFSDRLTNARKAMGWSRKRAVSEIGIPYPTYSNYEQGKREPDISTIAIFAEKLNTSADYLLGRTNNPSPSSTNSEITDSDLNKMIDNAKFFDGKPIDDHDKELVRGILKRIYNEK
ncbi:hypothetical protein AEL93_08000 [Lactobacillus crispatus]|jgi:hypothetical protein|uniref:Helix-turn-helix domain-containing protein n=1 Tax=Lactobacillus crispatus TaxID=47770 RepID=A0A6B8SRI3_9LACO|nr:helix-turn-helix transcriptional regulator [Lactobacillus crispatus]KWX58006.1 hypothetical protein AEL93_08000 [Lactobacillus crispatus]MCT7772874.1 helix-turn-helix domain-containing protein [Lactobacillus crispatus]MCT7832944.1 helix-turn-helix domain-containing protein [Lactobacillus crispatus]MCZ3675778.1 helix-turn-helix domain-containing protein [Lactobacillus crispatus]MCZ3683363.1 helix-turn-helix domain-containing protein [Lactobacillus crispatus]